MKRFSQNGYNSFSLGSLIFSVTSLLIMLMLSKKGIYVFIGSPLWGIPYYFLYCLFIFVICVSSIDLVSSKFEDKGLTAITIVGSFFILAGTCLYGLLMLDAGFTTFSSPNGREHFLVVETGTGNLYQLSNTHLFMTHLADIRTDDRFKPFSNEAYQLEWKNPNELVIKYGFDSMSLPEKYRELKVTYNR